MDKPEVIARVLQAEDRGLTMIFSRTKRTAQKVADDLVERGFAAAAVHGDLGQGAREQALRAFRSGKVDVLVATDVAARGIDIDDVTHVINYQCPDDEKTYVHRIGRTGRAGRTGVAVTLVDWDEMPRWKLISDTLGLDKPEPVETYSSSPHLFADLGIPAGKTGRLPLANRTRAGLGAEEEEDLGGKRRGPRGRGNAAAPAPSEDAPRKRNRTPRKRTRGGSQAGEATEAADNAAAPASSDDAPASEGRTRARRRTRGTAPEATGPATEKEAGDNAERPARRRRRRRPAATSDTPASAD
jgi:superfamily II DNA/RNA helicase